MPADSTISDDLRQWIASATDASNVELRQVSGGASREAWLVDATTEAGTRALFLRYDRRKPKPGSAFHPLPVEARILRELHRHGIAVPEVVAIHPECQAFLMERISGETWFRLIRDEAEQVSVARDFIDKLAAMHRLDAHEFDLPELGPVRTVTDHVLDEISAMRGRLATHRDPSALLAAALDWLEAKVPAYSGPVVLVQGDTGPGNFLYENGKVTAIIDWELAHYGDPMDDIAWLSLRTVQDTFTDFPARLAEYEERSGHRIDPARVWYYRLLAEVRLAVQHPGRIESRVAAGPRTADAGTGLLFGMLHRRLLVEAFAHVLDLPEDLVALPSEEVESPNSPLYESTLFVLESVAGRTGDSLALRWTKGAARMIKYLAEIDRFGPIVERQEIDELTTLLGERPSSLDRGRLALGELLHRGEVSLKDYVAQLLRGIRRDDFLMRTASGALYRRTWPALTRGD